MVKQRVSEASGAKATVEFRKKHFDLLKRETGRVTETTIAEAEGQYRSALVVAEAAEFGVENGKTDIAVKGAKLAQAEAGVATARANVEAAKVGLEKARLAMTQTRITAPAGGIVSQRGGAIGDFVRHGDRADTVPLFTIMQQHVVRMAVGIPQGDISRVAVGQPVELAFDALPGVRVTGKVGRIGCSGDERPGTS